MNRKAKKDTPSRREALRRLACGSVVAYVGPEILFMNAAYAEDAAPSAPNPIESLARNGDDHEETLPVSPEAPVERPEPAAVEPVAPQERDHTEVDRNDEVARESCNTPSSSRTERISISRSDLTRSQEAIQAGAARPLDEIWGNFTSRYDGRVIGVEFLGRRSHTRYRFRAISATGRLETVTISAQTGTIEKIVGCG